MHKYSGLVCAAALTLALVPLNAVETKYWQQEDLSDFEKGNLDKLSLRSDGQLSLAPVVSEILDSSTPYLWTIAQDSKGNVYTAGGGPNGSTAKLYRINSAGKSDVLAELDGLEIHAIAVDARDRVYAATAPDGKVFRIVNGKPEVFFDPKAKYIWTMCFSKAGDLYIATGDKGEIFKVSPDGKGSAFFKTEETHARSMALDNAGNLIVGTDPSGLILQVTPAGEGFVLYQAAKREITAIAVAQDGSIYAAGVGNKSAAPAGLTPPIAPVPVPSPSAAPGARPAPGTVTVRTAPLSPSFGSAASATPVTGGSELYRIGTDGAPRRLWTNAQDLIYALTTDAQGHAVVGTGNKGYIYRIDSDLSYTLLVNLAPTQVTAFLRGSDGRVYAATGNIGKLYRIGPELEKSGTYESDAFDAGAFTYWGRLSYSGSPANGGIRFEARSGNVSRPQKNWSSWSAVPITGDGGRIAAPAARFLQYRAVLTGAATIRNIDVAYMSKNVAPAVTQIEVTPPNYRFTATPATIPASPSPQSISLPALGTKKKQGNTPTLESTASQAMQYAKGTMGARWSAQDENDDTLIYRVEIRGEQEKDWKLLRDKVRDKFLNWDSSMFPDGKYLLRVTASDAPGNPPAEALTGSIESYLFLIDNTPPQITGLTASPSGNRVEVRWRAKDALSVIDRAEYSINGGEWIVVEPVSRLSDSPELDYRLNIDRPTGSAEYTIAVRVIDDYDNQAVAKTVVR